MPKIQFATDFRGGYATDVPSEQMEPNMLLKAENVIWKDGLVNRGGISQYTTLTTDATAVRGTVRSYQNGVWYTIAAIDNGTGVSFYKSSGTTWAAYSTDSTAFQTSYTVEMDQLGEQASSEQYVVAVNGYNRPQVLYYSTANTRFTCEPLDKYDTRTIGLADWYAGYVTTATTAYVDYTSLAQSTGSGTFGILATTYVGSTVTTACGHYIASDYPFTKVVYSSAQLLSTHATVAYYYWTTGSGWSALTSLLETAPTWTTSAGDRTVQIPYLSDWGMLDSTAYSTLLDYKYVVRVDFPVAPSTAAYCQSIALSDVHYLTRIMADEKPSLVKTHANHVFMATDNNVQYSNYGTLKDWDEINVEYFEDGGPSIIQMVSHLDYILMIKPGALYGFYTNDWSNLTKRKLSVIGSQYPRSAAVIGQLVFFLAFDGVRLWNGTENILVSKHIKSDIDGWTKTNANGLAYKGQYWLSFPSTSIILVCDPDTFRRDDIGDGRVSWYKFTGGRSDQFLYNYGANDNDYILGVSNTTAPSLYRFENGNHTDGTTGTAFTKDVKTKYLTDGSDFMIKRIKPEIAGIGSWSLILSADHGESTLTTDVTAAITTTHGNRYMTTISVPYKFDGRSFAMELQTASTGAVTIYSLAYDPAVRRY